MHGATVAYLVFSYNVGGVTRGIQRVFPGGTGENLRFPWGLVPNHGGVMIGCNLEPIPIFGTLKIVPKTPKMVKTYLLAI